MKLAVIVHDHAAAANVAGGIVQSRVYTFDMPPKVAEFVAKKLRDNHYNTITLSIAEEPT